MAADTQYFINEITLTRRENTFKAAICCCYFQSIAELERILPYLHVQERSYYDTLKFEKRMRSYLLGRFAAKQAAAALTGEEELANIHIQAGIFDQPILSSAKRNIQVSITHCNDYGAAIAFPEAHPMGIDLEKIDDRKRTAIESHITMAEKEYINPLPIPLDTALTLLWSAKEALSKVLKTGLTASFKVFEVSKIERYDDYFICFYKNFKQYKAIAFSVGSYMSAIACPLNTEMDLDICSFKQNVALIESLSR
ncbi:4'-phosphopantetheinyl transferase superfamily protein [Paenibacillus sp. HN-1]|uniref:4'-phosphopantetheinyl transferase family protein n=1 Tax=Paenibacillus TaxID=44249 RepID=UPI001CA9BAA9|nr:MULTISPECIES: 4'-phosphopantetheinyl transferase superfamily protein [Paenibacillus]MBY9081321.1 4'-phosphopantetheinyl transferase superfamily protein [Paenibacillus sp. CGMCC 1.18879]MBY9086494.1 4'-phosphopantetheinyl transferase superfamily protein [Paenibacillus sinensis]